jgi:hypothetical protein
MRAGFALIPFVLAVGCQAPRYPSLHESRAEIPAVGYVSLERLADRLEMDYLGESNGSIEISAPPDHITFTQDSRDALVGDRWLSLKQPCLRRGADFVVCGPDADLISTTLASVRAGREPAPPLPRVPHATVDDMPATGLPAAWRPRAGVPTRPWRAIVIHHAAVKSGDAETIHRMHLGNGWDGLGYHFVVGNGTQSADGEVEVGFRWRDQLKGAHARARPGDDNRWNLHSIGICLVGDFTTVAPSQRQMDALVRLVRALLDEYGIPADSVVPHSFVHATECPGARFPWAEFMSRIR